jgi:hypothetical protein
LLHDAMTSTATSASIQRETITGCRPDRPRRREFGAGGLRERITYCGPKSFDPRDTVGWDPDHRIQACLWYGPGRGDDAFDYTTPKCEPRDCLAPRDNLVQATIGHSKQSLDLTPARLSKWGRLRWAR